MLLDVPAHVHVVDDFVFDALKAAADFFKRRARKQHAAARGRGERIAQPLMYEENDTFKSYSGYEILTVKPQDGMTTAFFPWKEIGGTISISRLEERKNSGEAALLKLLEKKIMQAEMSIKAKVNQQLLQGTVDTATLAFCAICAMVTRSMP